MLFVPWTSFASGDSWPLTHVAGTRDGRESLAIYRHDIKAKAFPKRLGLRNMLNHHEGTGLTPTWLR